jgi:2-polyprenyl-3-methyl-5-hydroxy-6-metoxy-1,4-benzoquinol methylase
MSDIPAVSSDSYRHRIYQHYNTICGGLVDSACERTAERWGKLYDWYLRGWLPESRDISVLDAGCGRGWLLKFYKKRGYTHVDGVDVSPEQVHLARQVIPAVAEANVLEFLEGHADAYDFISALDLIEHLNKDEVLRFLDGCRSSLKPGGRLVIQTPNADSPFGLSLRYGDFTHENGFNAHSLTNLFQLCGFTSVAIREQGPVPWGYSLRSSVRYLIWQCIRTGLSIWNMTETGSPGSGVFTRNILITALRPIR